MEAIFSLIQLIMIPIVAIAMFATPWIRIFYIKVGEVKSVIYLAYALIVLHIVGIIIAEMAAPTAGLATFFSGIICFILFVLALIPAKIAATKHLKHSS